MKFKKDLQEELNLAPITSYVDGQRKEWLRDMRISEEETIRTVLKWKPNGKRPRSRSRKI